ncbi:MAG: LCP family protein [Cyanobacteriota bacterium]|nr:LCP family protein [Cyanobacteriota bacterium]
MARRTSPASAPNRRQRAAVRIGAAAIGVGLGVGTLGLVWPKPDRSLDTRQQLTPADLAKPPSRPVTVLVIGIDGERLGDGVNGAAPRGAANADALLLVRVNPVAPTQVLSLPPELAVKLPGQSQPLALGSLYRLGGAALVGDAVRELVGMDSTEPDRYLVLSRSALRNLVDDLGGIEASPSQAMRYRDKSQNFTIDLEAGLQRLQGRDVEQLVRFRDPLRPVESRIDDQQEAARGLLKAMALPAQLPNLPGLLGSLKGEVATNLSETEALSLLAAALGRTDALQVSTVPLSLPKASQAPLRQLSPQAALPLWPPAQAAAAP